MAVIRPIQAQRTIDVGGVPSTQIDTSVAQGLRQLGNSVRQASSVFADIDARNEQQRLKMEEFRTDQAFRQFEDDNALLFDENKLKIDPSGDGFVSNVSGQIGQRTEQFIKTVPDALKPKFAELAKTAREEWLNKAARAEIDQRNNWYRDGVQKSLETRQTQVFNDPTLFDAAKSDGYRAIDSSGLPETEKKALREKWDETLAITVGEREVRNAETDPATARGAASRLGVTGASPVETVVSRIIGVESGGKATAQNPNSSAGGLGQFIDSTWLATVRAHRPDIAAGKSKAEILALKKDASPAGKQLQRDMVTAYTNDNAKALVASGMPVTPGSLYLAHFAGVGGAKEVLRADPNASLSDVLGPQVIAANGFLRGKSAGWLISWADGKMKGGATPQAPADPRYASLSLEKRLQLYDQTLAAAQRGQNAIEAQAKADSAAEDRRINLGIRTGQVASEYDILNNPLLDDGQKSARLGQFREQRKDSLATAEAIKLFSEGNLRVDPYDTSGRKTVDNAWNEVSKAVPQEKLQPAVEEMVRQTGVVPQGVVNEIRQGLTSTDLQMVMQAAQTAQRISTVDPAALGRRDGGSDVQKAADDFSYYVNRLNLPPEDAARRLAENRNPEKQRERKAIEPAAKEFVKTLQDFDLAGEFDDSVLGLSSNPSLGMTPDQEWGIKAEFLAIAEDQFFQANGDPELAKNRAVAQMKRLYGVTEFGGVNAIVRHPPERYWPKSIWGTTHSQMTDFGFGREGVPTLDYAQKQLADDVLTMHPDADTSRIQLITTPETERMIKRGEMPGYAVLYYDANGERQTLPGKLWRPDITKAIETNKAIEGRQSEELLDNARREQMQQRQQLPFRTQTPQDFLSGDDPVFGDRDIGPPAPQKPDTPANQIQQQRQQLFKDAQQNGTLTPGGGM